MYSIIDKLISESDKNNKLINDIPEWFRFSSNINISRKKSKTIPVTSTDMRKGNKSQAVHTASI